MKPTSKPFRRVAIIAKPDPTGKLRSTLQQLQQVLRLRDVDILPDQQAAKLLDIGQGQSLDAMTTHADMAVVVGGDGTLLSAARQLADHHIPVLGVNLGRLGFLVDITPADIETCLDPVLDGSYEEEQRFLLEASVGDGPSALALNDVVLHKWNTARMIEFETWIDGRFVYTQRSDGIIVSTPTGSTAYALSGGGPLLTPNLQAIALVPICPHTLSNRPIVIDAQSELRLSVCGGTDPGDVRVTCDGAAILELQAGDVVNVRRHHTPIRLLHPRGHDHFDVLRAKLGWGESPEG